MPTPTDIQIRTATAADVQHFPAIENSAAKLFSGDADLAWIADAPDLPVDRYRAILAEKLSWLAMDRELQPIGFLCGTREQDELHVWEMAVRCDHQRRGIGGALLRTAIRAANDLAVAGMTLTTFRDVAWNAPYYGRYGFEIIPTAELNGRLRRVLENEVSSGLPRARRCAMRLTFSAAPRQADNGVVSSPTGRAGRFRTGL